MFATMFTVLIIAFIVGIVGSFIFIVFGCIYVIPYSIWSAKPEVTAIYGDVINGKSGFKQLHNATVYYKHCLFGKELTF